MFMGFTPIVETANLGMSDSLILMVLALVVFGPRRLPKIGRQIGKLMYEFRKASNDFKYQMEEELRNAEEADRRKREEDERQRALASSPPPAQIEAVSQVPEAAEAAVMENTAADASAPDQIDAHHAEITAGNTANEAGQEPREAEPQPDRLSVHPPATGAPVPAERPTSRALDAAAAAEQAAAHTAEPETASAAPEPESPLAPETPSADVETAETPAKMSPVEENILETEPAAHHG